MLKVSDITIKKLENGDFKNELPEFYKLRSIIHPQGSWHNGDSVFEHTIRILKTYQNLIGEYDYLNLNKDILFLVVLFHDIGKSIVFEGHAEKSYQLSKDLLERFDLSISEKELILSLIRNHGEIHNLIKEKESAKEILEILKSKFPDFFKELILFGIFDMVGSDLEENEVENFKNRMNLYKNIIRLAEDGMEIEV